MFYTVPELVHFYQPVPTRHMSGCADIGLSECKPVFMKTLFIIEENMPNLKVFYVVLGGRGKKSLNKETKITKFRAPRVAESLKVMAFNSSAPVSASAGVLSLSLSSCRLVKP